MPRVLGATQCTPRLKGPASNTESMARSDRWNTSMSWALDERAQHAGCDLKRGIASPRPPLRKLCF
eukprot:14623157-Alexandrium_andersonii.AAC.1